MPDFAVILLAAGASSRMGRPKLLLPWGDTTLLGHLVGRWRQLGATQLAAVIAGPGFPAAAALADALDRLGVQPADRIVNPQPARGMFSSVQCAAGWPGWKPSVTHWVLTLGDQPLVRTATLDALLQFAARHPDAVCQPARQGRPRHPVVLPAAALRRLAEATSDNLKQFLAADPGSRCLMESDDAGLDFDLDEPADYERALRLAAEAGEASA